GSGCAGVQVPAADAVDGRARAARTTSGASSFMEAGTRAAAVSGDHPALITGTRAAMADVAEIARRAGVTEDQARVVLAAAGAVEREPRAAAPAGFADFAIWAAAAVVVGSVAVFVVIEDGFESDPRSKGSVLAVALLVAVGALAIGRLARTR